MCAGPNRRLVEDILSGVLLLLFLGGMGFSWLDWRRRARKLPSLLGPSWPCPNCNVVNEAELTVCWSCGAAIAGRARFGEPASAPTTWRCTTCHAWNGVNRRSCWSCSTAPTAQKKRSA